MAKILCLIDGLGSGGAQRQLVGLAKLLREKRHEVHFLWYYDINFFENELQKCNVKCVKFHNKNKINLFYSIFKYTKQEQFDSIISYLRGPNLINCLLKIVGIKAKVYVSERNTSQKLDSFQKFLFNMYRVVDGIVPNSYSQMNFISKHFPNLSSKITTITNFVDTDYYRPTNESCERRGRLKILTVSRIVPQKNVIGYMQAIIKVRERGVNVHFDWYGRHKSDEYWDQVLAFYRENNMQDILSFHDPVQNIIDAYNQSDILALPSFHEGYPNVVCEAMSCGLPIICSNVCDNATIVSDKENGFLFDPYDVSDIASKIIDICSLDKSDLKKFKERSRALSIEKFSKDDFVLSYIKLIDKA